ncbi:MAG: SatD family protein [Candidatus Brocadia sp.]|nr:SatD family protein [Candidatus Brocadia sp.]
MRNNGLYAVITGDIVGSSRLTASQRGRLLSVLKSSFKTIKDILPDGIRAPFEIHRGDSFQGVLSKPGAALRAAIVIRAGLRYGFQTKQRRYALDARIAVGIGQIEFLRAGRGAEGDGEAFRRSGQTLDVMKGDQRLIIRTPWKEVDAEFDIACALLDALVTRWSAEQAQAILGQIRGLTQEKAAREFGISQPAVRQRLKRMFTSGQKTKRP